MNGEIVPGDILVIRYEGCKGAPGMKELMLSIDALIGRGLDKKVGLITDARFSGFNYGAIVGHVSPEAASGGPIAFVEEGDLISYSVEQRTLNVTGIAGVPCTPKEAEAALAERAAKGIIPREPRKGFYRMYTSYARSAMQGGGLE